MAYTIGLPPKNNTLSKSSNILDNQKTFLKIILTPMKIAQGSLKEAAGVITGRIALEDATKEFKERLNLLGISNIEPPLNIHVLSESAISDTYTNSLENITLVGKLSNMLADTEISQTAFILKSAGINPLLIAKDINNFVSSLIPSANAGYGNFLLDKLSQINQAIQSKTEIENKLKQLGASESLSSIGGSLASTAANILSGNKPIFPKLWWDSNYSGSYNFSVRLYNPNPASQTLHEKTIIEPLSALLVLALPNIGGEDSNTYEAPLYVSLKCPGLFSLDYAAITNMSIIKGGDENAIAFNNRPAFVDVRFTVTPIYEKRIIGGSVKGVNEKSNIDALKEENNINKIEKNTTKTNAVKVETANISSLEPEKRVDSEKIDIYNDLKEA